MKILIVDDDEISVELLRGLLLNEGYEVDVAHDGHEALSLLDKYNYRLIISDWEMPKMTGVELCRAVRSHHTSGYVYIILLTARNSKKDIVEGMSAGADDFLCKPFDAPELLVRLRAGMRILSLETRDMAIFSMAKLAESRDPETGNHLERIRSYCREISRCMLETGAGGEPVDLDFAHMIYLTSPLHDIGKVGIPDSILLKPGRLSDSEFEIMKTHALIGAETLDAAVREYPQVAYLNMARDIALCHHERYDGKGYPRGLAGREVPLAARVVALADVYDALTSRRVYKESFIHPVARNIIVDGDGTHFDPNVVKAFLEAESDIRAIQKRFSDESRCQATTPENNGNGKHDKPVLVQSALS